MSEQSQSLQTILQGLRSEGRLMAIEDSVYLVKGVLTQLEKSAGFNGDLSPQNIVVFGKNEIRLADGVSTEKFRYMSPERVLGTVPNLAANVFSLGLIFWRLLFGRDIFASGSANEVAEKIKDFSLPPLPTNRKVSDDVLKVLGRMLAKDVNQRISASSAASELAGFLKKHKPGYSAKILKPAEADPFKGILTGNREIDMAEIHVYQPPLEWKRWVLLVLILGAGAAYRYQPVLSVQGASNLIGAIKRDYSKIVNDGQKVMDQLSNENLLQPKPSAMTQKIEDLEHGQPHSAEQNETAVPGTPGSAENVMPLKLQTIPAGAEVWVNSSRTKFVTPTQLDVPSGNTLSVTFKLTGYKPCPAFVSAKIGTFTCRLQRLNSSRR